MSVLEYLHDEYMSQINELSSLIETVFECEDEVLSIGKILMNLSANPSNLDSLLKLTVIIRIDSILRLISVSFSIKEC